ncbi:MAG TPA: hypothetical protein VEK76_02815 [Candidatus Binatia bacterium]|nr:hypothetical protein [Candidatus Binatia bacterium]
MQAAPSGRSGLQGVRVGERVDPPADDLSVGCFLGLLAGEGHFGGDGRQPQVTLRMHVRHEKLFRWLVATFPGGRLYGPYDHAGRRYYQWMARGRYLREEVAPLIQRHREWLDDHVGARFDAMCARYGIAAAPAANPPAAVGLGPPEHAPYT